MIGARASRLVAGVVAWGLLASVFLLPARRPLPFDACPLHRFTGFPCLTCGLTRSVCLFARGEWGASLSMHPAGWLAFATLLAACGWLAAEAVSDRDLGRALRVRLLGAVVWAGGVLSLLGLLARLAGYLPAV